MNTAHTSLLFMVSILANCLVTPVLLLEMLTAYRLGVIFEMSASTLRSGDNLRFLLCSSLGYLKLVVSDVFIERQSGKAV